LQIAISVEALLARIKRRFQDNEWVRLTPTELMEMVDSECTVRQITTALSFKRRKTNCIRGGGDAGRKWDKYTNKNIGAWEFFVPGL
jgi:hypothetical protein